MAANRIQDTVETSLAQRQLPVQVIRTAVGIRRPDVACHLSRELTFAEPRIINQGLQVVAQLRMDIPGLLEPQRDRKLTAVRMDRPRPLPAQFARQARGCRGSFRPE